jgi:parallel beta-helix repeat protein
VRVEFKAALLLVLPTVLLVTLALSLSSAGPASATIGGLTPHVPIHIQNNSGFTPANGVVDGSGTENDPYIIENWSIDVSTAHGIWIENTTAHFIIRNCLVENGRGNYHYYRGIYLDNVLNGRIENNTCRNNYFGIQLYYSSYNNLSNNTCLNNDQGIRLDYQSDNNTLSRNTCENNREIGILLSSSEGVKMRNNTLSNNQHNFGVLGGLITDFNHDIDESNLVNGKPIRYLVGHSNEVVGFSVDVGYLGLVNCDNVRVANLTLGNNVDGILLAFTENSQVKNCTVENNALGIRLVSSVNNTLDNNTCENNYYYGIWLCYSDNNRICHNDLENNVSEGIGLFPYSSNNTLDNNNCLKNDDGICLVLSNNNTLSHNTCENNHFGITLHNSSNNRMFSNRIKNNNRRGIGLWNSDNNRICHNNIVNN